MQTCRGLIPLGLHGHNHVLGQFSIPVTVESLNSHSGLAHIAPARWVNASIRIQQLYDHNCLVLNCMHTGNELPLELDRSTDKAAGTLQAKVRRLFDSS